MVDLLFRNPCCDWQKKSLSSSKASICFLATRSHILTMLEQRLIGLTLFGLLALVFLGIGTTITCFRHSGMIPELKESLPIFVIMGIRYFLVFNINSLLIPPESVDLVGLISLIAS